MLYYDSSMASVYFLAETGRIKEALESLRIEEFQSRRVLVKLHFGEPGNRYYVSPQLVRTVVGVLKGVGAKPFLFDTTVLYSSQRSTVEGHKKVAQKHGFGADKIGCETVIGDKGVEVVDFGQRFGVAREVYDSTHLVVISHVKGHCMAGFGGAIKNLGMGCVTREAKRLVHHMSSLRHRPDECSLCGECAAACPRQAIVVGDGWSYDWSLCDGCGKCVSICPNDVLASESTSLQQGLAWAASVCVRGKRVIYVNALVNITRNCDCDPNPGPIICSDIGYLVSDEAAAIDRASLDLINEVKPGILEKTNRIDSSRQIQYAAEAGFVTDYELRRI
jgi:uncharacterized Fe-S center protein